MFVLEHLKIQFFLNVEYGTHDLEEFISFDLDVLTEPPSQEKHLSPLAQTEGKDFHQGTKFGMPNKNDGRRGKKEGKW